jgi:alkylation response protein AidB-like acyl-CoA dehydrogenase
MSAPVDAPADECLLVERLVGDGAEEWDLSGTLPVPLLRKLSTAGVLCAQVPVDHGGLGLSSRRNGELTAFTGALCSSLRSVMTSHGMAAWAIARFADRAQRRAYLQELTSGRLAAIGFSEPNAGSDLSAIETTIRAEGDSVVVDGEKVWVTAAHYADLIVVVGRYEEDAAAVVVPRDIPGVRVDRIANPVGCRAAGHATVRLDNVRLPSSAVLGGGGTALEMLVTTALTYGRMSVAWGCAGILRACLRAAVAHATGRTQFGRPLADHQLVARHLAEIFVSEQVSTRACEHASDRWDSGSPEVGVASVLAKHVSARNAASGANSAMQVLASAAARDGNVVARAHRDAKLMEIIEGTDEICQLILAEHAVMTAGRC